MTYYLDGAGHAGTDTSAAAAGAIRSKLKGMRAVVLAEVSKAGQQGSTADEIGEALALPRMSIQPRLSDLRNLGKIADSGARRANISGHQAIAWVLPEYAPDAQRAEAEALAQGKRRASGDVVAIVDRLTRFSGWLAAQAGERDGDKNMQAGAALVAQAKSLIERRCVKREAA